MTTVRMVSTCGILGYGFPEASLDAAMARGVDLVGADGGSTDPGPYYLGSGKPFVSPRAIRRDLRLMLIAARKHDVPLIVGTCGGAGGAPHLALVAEMARDIARECKLGFKMALIQAEQDKELIKRRIAQGRVQPLGKMPALDAATVDRAERIVGLMGPEPYVEALNAGAQVILGSRSTDPAPFAAVAMRRGIPAAQAWYAGKMLECGASPVTPKGPDCLVATVTASGVTCEPMGAERICTPMSMANFSLHENASPIRHVEPGGVLHTEACSFDAVTARATEVTGMRWAPADNYTVKLEAAELIGWRAVTFCATRDPVVIATIDDYLALVRAMVRKKAADLDIAEGDYHLTVHTYGRDGVMGAREPLRDRCGHELGFLVDVVAPSAELASAVIALARTTMLHTDFPGRLSMEGNMAFPLSPSDLPVGPAYRFSMCHVVLPDSPLEMFPITYEMV
ncbi:acyclic terpene utilization AtuA family protein [Ramlibacter sp.]|uniref:acyclic terpene utilization AtuA family protein n=1 Tax=Ramlibacter sp. TaxID=1917967 RepID=UPI003D0F3CBC